MVYWINQSHLDVLLDSFMADGVPVWEMAVGILAL